MMRSFIQACFLVFMLFGSVTAQAQPARLLVLGDSLSAGFGIALNKGWVSLLQSRLLEQGLDVEVINASISGDTTRGARERLPALLEQHQPHYLLIELGGNDGLRGISLDEMQDNLAAMIEMSRQYDTQVMLVRMMIPPNYGSVYTKRFASVFTGLEEQTGVVLLPFILEGIGDQPELMQDDGIHPVAEAQVIMLDNVWQGIQSTLENKDG